MHVNQMMGVRHLSSSDIGTYGHLAIFGGSLALVMLAPNDRILLAATLCLGVALLLYPSALKRVLQVRFIILCILLVLPAIFWVGVRDVVYLGIRLSSEGLQLAKLIIIRAVVVLVAIDGLTSSVEIASIAGMFERRGLRGLGFSIGVALNLLPTLRKSTQNTWRSLKMRGGIRRRSFRGLQLFGVTVTTNALRWAREVALAAEARAFSPDRSSPMMVRYGRLDRPIIIIVVLVVAGFLFIV